ncbi:MAG: hypothetical protein IT376_15870 [Polyangiaceae bacterium]|nr:hypothetical protein [Polyangiaceae bacterium]
MRTPVLASMMVGAPLLVNCGGLPGLPGAGCPADLKDPSAIMSANFGLEAGLEGKVKAALAAGAALEKLAVEVEGDVAMACGNLAKDLGADDAAITPKEEGPGKKAEAACQAAVKLIGEFKAKASGKIEVKVVPPKCSASMNAMAECAGSCDASVKGGKAEVKCEGGEISGKCGGECKGSCTVAAGAECKGTCGGTCEGSCDAEFSGKCTGKCDGTCEGGTSKDGKCDGTCKGKCEAGGSGSCGGTCGGKCDASCEVKGQAKCEGSCSGGCSVEIEEPKCSGTVQPPEMSAECKANCDAQVSGKLECTPASVKMNIAGAADAAAAGKLVAAVQKNLPALLKVTLGMKAKLEGAVANVKATIEGVQAAVKGGGAAALKVAGCFVASIQAQAQASVSINVSVSASASASGEAGAG